MESLAKTHPMYGTDMWRGGVWLNLNYFVFVGLKGYGFDDVAAADPPHPDNRLVAADADKTPIA